MVVAIKHICANLIVAVTKQNFSLGMVMSWCKSNVAGGQKWSVPPPVPPLVSLLVSQFKLGEVELLD